MRVKIRGNDDKSLNVRKFLLDRKKKVLYYVQGKMISKRKSRKLISSKEFAEKMVTAGTIDLSKLDQVLMENGFSGVMGGRVERQGVGSLFDSEESLLEE